jgi:hypothetical protein
LFNKIFPFLHLGGLLAVLAYAVMSLVRGNVPRSGLIIILLAIYYIFLLHPAVKKEIARRRTLNR